MTWPGPTYGVVWIAARFALGHPVAGDVAYGRRKPGEPARPMLHAWRLRFRHPRTAEQMEFEARPPADFVEFQESLR
jgi:23S rRNA pseudouridine1911/1915/1917 synthase